MGPSERSGLFLHSTIQTIRGDGSGQQRYGRLLRPKHIVPEAMRWGSSSVGWGWESPQPPIRVARRRHAIGQTGPYRGYRGPELNLPAIKVHGCSMVSGNPRRALPPTTRWFPPRGYADYPDAARASGEGITMLHCTSSRLPPAVNLYHCGRIRAISGPPGAAVLSRVRARHDGCVNVMAVESLAASLRV